MNRIVAFGLVGPLIVGLLGAFIYVPAIVYLSGQISVSADTYEVAFVLFLLMGLVPGWSNLVIVALDWTKLRSSIGAGLFGGAVMAYLPKLAGLPPENPIVCALVGIVASSAGWRLSIRNRVSTIREDAHEKGASDFGKGSRDWRDHRDGAAG
jgi:hypothetical protein